MAHESVKVNEIVDRAVNHAWSVPEFQRGFVWKPVQVRDLIESLWLDYPIGAILLWDSRGPVVERLASDAQRPSLWLVDGQQRTTALCILFGRKPYWWPSKEEWEKTVNKFDIRFDIHTKEPPYFHVANAAIRKVKEPRYVKVSSLMVMDVERNEEDGKRLQALAKDVKLQGLCDGMDSMEVYSRLDRVRKIRDKEMVKITINHELEDVVEIFGRLNSRGTRVTEADIYLGIVAGRNPGWVKNKFLPYLDQICDLGFDVDPNLLFRSVTAIGADRVRFTQVPDTFWNAETITNAWARAVKTWNDMILRLREFGVMTNSILPTENALVTLGYLVEKFPSANFKNAFYWFLQASRFGRYSGSATTSLDEDLKDISESSDQKGAIKKLLARIPGGLPAMTGDDFMRDYGDSRFGRFMLYLLVYRNSALDWDEKKHRLGFQGQDVLAGFEPQWHHVFPKKFLDVKYGEDMIDALGNIAVIGPSINIRISNRAPLDYINRYKIDSARLQQQFITGAIDDMTLEGYPTWVSRRAGTLSERANEFLSELRVGLD
jgi:hypothetical protein